MVVHHAGDHHLVRAVADDQISELLAHGRDATRIWVAPLDFEPDVALAAALKRHYPHPPKY